jgi:hypothetical protein
MARVAIVVGALAACADPSGATDRHRHHHRNPDRCPEDPIEEEIDHVAASCDGDGNVSYRIQTNGLTADGLVWAIETGSPDRRDEEHDVLSFEFDAMCYSLWDGLQVTLTPGGDYVRDVTTAFTCDDLEGGAMTYAFAVWEFESAVADCRVGGRTRRA